MPDALADRGRFRTFNVADDAIQYIQPGKPNQNAYIERFNRTFPEEVLAGTCSLASTTCWWMLEL